MRNVRRPVAAAIGALACCAAPSATALAAPQVTLRARAVPIPKHIGRRHSRNWRHTGDILGKPAAVRAKIKIKGTEYGGFPAPLREVVVYLPKGTKIHSKRFKACPVSRLARQEPERCPKRSLAGRGKARGTVRFGESEPVKETVSLTGYFRPGGGLTFWIEGRHPVLIEQYASGRLRPIENGRFGQRLRTEVPLIETVPGAPFASTEAIDVTVGAAYKRHGRLISYGTMPNRCPRRGFPVKAVLAFGAGPDGSGWQRVAARSKAPCPRGSRRHHRKHHRR